MSPTQGDSLWPYHDNSKSPLQDHHNPFIFRRYADSHVSPLVNTVFALPATLATFTNAYRAREQCLLGPAHVKQCDRLEQLEDRIIQAATESRQLSHAGNFKALIITSEELQNLGKEVDDVRKRIIERAMDYDPIKRHGGTLQGDLAEKLVTGKVRRRGWLWSWGLPNPFDEERPQSWRERCHCEAHGPQDDGPNEVNQLLHIRSIHFQSDIYTPRTLERNRQLWNSGIQWKGAFEDLIRAESGSSLILQKQRVHAYSMSCSPWARRFWDTRSSKTPASPRQTLDTRTESLPWEGDETSEEPSYEYEHDHEDQHDEVPALESRPRESLQNTANTELDAYEQFFRSANLTGVSHVPDKPSIISTLTTTQRTVTSDGTVITTVVLKKRFSNGAEEESETVHTLCGHRRDTEIHDSADINQQRSCLPLSQLASEGSRKSNKKAGWFWSG